MAIPRKKALEALLTYKHRIEEHFAKIAKNPDHTAVDHWKHEIRVWLAVMERMVLHVGKKTGAEWRPIIQSFQEAVHEENP